MKTNIMIRKVSASTNKFLRAGGRFYFLLIPCFSYKSGMPTSTFQEQGTVTLVAWFRPDGACVLGGWPRITIPSVLPGASSARAPLYFSLGLVLLNLRSSE